MEATSWMPRPVGLDAPGRIFWNYGFQFFRTVGTNTDGTILHVTFFVGSIQLRTTDVKTVYNICTSQMLHDAPCIAKRLLQFMESWGVSLGSSPFFADLRIIFAPLISAGMGAKPAKSGRYGWLLCFVAFVV